MSKEITKDSGLRVIVKTEGEGDLPKRGQQVSVHYNGFLEDGTKFDSSYDRKSPFTFQVGQGRVIKGWDEGVMEMKPDSKHTLIIPSELGYGSRGAGNTIPPDSILIFEVERIK